MDYVIFVGLDVDDKNFHGNGKIKMKTDNREA
jgi:hypothetical protein